MEKILKKIGMIDISVVIIATIMYVLENWTLRTYVNFLTVAGFAAVCIGSLSLLGHWESTRSFKYQYASSVGKRSIPEHTKRLFTELTENYGFFILMFVTGGILILISVAVDKIFG
ncbi:MAG TPA: hypothetical protein ENG20_04560 [Methanomicrobia archaeon]|nr:hypothetical protein [Methanomicrobia archaeon]